uniref:Ig-like domain-containing protein n=1 Tax=Poecilia mexicana TaxID=48701 RepID=A0A3B3XJT6_9TELE
MIVRVAALILFFSTTALIHTVEASHLISLTLVDVGDNITFDCKASEKDLKFVNWYKQSLGYMVEIVGSVILGQPTISEKFKGSHFAITIKGSRYDLTIFNISKEDEATYLCHIGTTYSQKFISGTFLAVNDDKQQKSLYLKQHPNSRTESERFHPGIIYTQRNISDKDLDRSCSYSLSVRDSSDAGVYYSAVVACGSIVIGEGTKVEMSMCFVFSTFHKYITLVCPFWTTQQLAGKFHANRRSQFMWSCNSMMIQLSLSCCLIFLSNISVCSFFQSRKILEPSCRWTWRTVGFLRFCDFSINFQQQRQKHLSTPQRRT